MPDVDLSAQPDDLLHASLSASRRAYCRAFNSGDMDVAKVCAVLIEEISAEIETRVTVAISDPPRPMNPQSIVWPEWPPEHVLIAARAWKPGHRTPPWRRRAHANTILSQHHEQEQRR